MASKSETTQYTKAISKYLDSQITEALECLEKEEQIQLGEMMKKIHSRLQNVGNGKVQGPKQRKGKTGATPEEKFKSMIEQIMKKLDEYEEDARVDVWAMDFTIEDTYDDKSYEQLCDHHIKLVNSCLSAEKVKLLCMNERGKLYAYLRYNSGTKFIKSWEEICKDLKICRRTADRLLFCLAFCFIRLDYCLFFLYAFNSYQVVF